ncbi:hypothetical protein [Microbacterium sp. LWO13-1.2]|uniref:hypothetical protein n=1 Tax=Microbacterium sp. LWO13-1.2 TaxID=3135262 RepID=UPI003138F29F
MPVKRASTTWWVLLLLAVLCVFPVATAAISQAGDAGADVVDSCRDSSDTHDREVSSAEITAMPAGRHCEWRSGVETQTGWPVTVAALIGSAICLIVTAFALRQGGSGRRLMSLLPLIAIGAIWFVIWSSTLFVIVD